ncbi:rhodanese-like domain-containing protein [Brevibacillus choshinensis]|uniref:rhodanese-like domain-containing protein n=1 Tax=Brevibacillus choshinensis TaxID=54911 RepID=UPI002E20D006|nr:rhodanese-like domain-containing protein [Brevibacillus choshinensis]
MRKIWLIFFLVLLLTASIYWKYYSNNFTLETTNTLQVINTESLTEMINSQTDMVIVDLREPELFKKGRVLNSINIPYDEIKERYTSIPKDKKVVFVCHTGRMGTESGNLLLEKGYRNVYNLGGGMAKWTGEIENN